MVITGRVAVQEAAYFMARTMEVAVLIPTFKALKVIRVVIINNLAREVSSSSNLDIRVIQSS